jgi:diacylglycerol O-acyltransferase / wax synthase
MSGPSSAGRGPVDRASPADLLSLAADAGSAPMHVGAVLLLDTGSGFDAEAIETVLASRVRAIPRLRQRLVRTPLGCGRPVWVDDPDFDVRRHLWRAAWPVPGDEPALLELTAALLTEPLSRAGPLWRAVLVTTADGARAALIMVLHHVLADGIGGLAILANLVDGAPDPVGLAFPAAAPSTAELARETWTARLRALGRLPRLAQTTRRVLAELPGSPRPAAHCSLNRPTGPRRRIAVARADLARLRATAHGAGGTVNDALLTAITGALHTVLLARNEQVGTLVVSVPVSTRRSASATRLGNQVGVMPVALPATGTSGTRLARTAAITRARKGVARGASALPLDSLFRLLGALGVLRWLTEHQRLVHTFVSNLRGPDRPLCLHGTTISGVIPLSATTGNVTVAFTALSYAGTLTVTMIADPDHAPDLATLRTALQTELDQLTFQA